MRVLVLGSAAGGGFPQWNCNCTNCHGLRSGSIRAKPRSQASIAISADGVRWCIVNASPDLRAQIISAPMLAPKSGARATPINAVLLSDAELDHVSGLLSLRETQPIRLYCTGRVFDWVFRSNPVFEALIRPAKFNCTLVEKRALHAICNCDGEDTGLAFEAFFVAGKVPAYVRESSTQAEEASTVAYRIVDIRRGTSLFYIPTIRQLDEELIAALPSCDCLMFDGSFWSEHEMESCGVGSRTASAMGHLPIDGPEGSLARLSGLSGVRKIYTHINNTNPILDETSPQRRAVEKAGWVVAEDAMDFEV